MRVRAMVVTDLAELIELQEAGAVVGMAEVFPQDRFPFPSETILERWRNEIDDPAIETLVATDDAGRLTGFAAITGSHLLHFGTAIDTWGDGTASDLLARMVERLRAGRGRPTLHVFEDNGRARAFYSKHGWHPTGASVRSAFEPHPVLLEYELPAH